MSRYKDTIVLVMCADDAYAIPSAVSLYSALENISSEYYIKIFYLSIDVSDDSKRRTINIINRYENARLNWLEVDSDCLPGVETRHSWLDASAYVSLIVPRYLADRYKKALFIDGDTLVESCLSGLWEVNPEPFAVAACRDQWIPLVSCPSGLDEYKELNIEYDTPYFNSGVLLYNLDVWRKRSISRLSCEYLYNNSKKINLADQGVLNATLANDWMELAPYWNVHHKIGTKEWWHSVAAWPNSEFRNNMPFNYEKLLSEPKILHFAGPAKPWIIDNYHPQALRWFRYFWDSGWLANDEWLHSVANFYTRYYTRALRESTRPLRHWMADSLPFSFGNMLRSYAD